MPDVVPGRHRLMRYLRVPEELPLERLAETPWCVRYALPERSLRGPAVPGAPLPGVRRIVVVGDSFTFGDGVAEGRTLPAQLGAELGERYEVLNCGQAGSNLGGYVEILERVLPRYTPSRVLVVCIPNDVHVPDAIHEDVNRLNDLVNVRPEYIHEDEVRPWWARASHLASAAYDAWHIRRVTRQTLQAYVDAHDPERNPEGIREARETFAALRGLNATRGVPVAVVVFPMMHRPGDDDPLAPAHELLVELAREADLPVLDLANVFDGIDPAELRVHDVDHHPNGRAFGIAAQRVGKWLRDDVPGFLDGE